MKLDGRVTRGNTSEGVVKRGFYGCRGELVRVELNPPPRVYPRAIDVPACPACGHGHGAQPFWRRRKDNDDAEVKEVLVLPYTPPS